MMAFKLNIDSLKGLELVIGKTGRLDTTLATVPFFTRFRGLPIPWYRSAF